MSSKALAKALLRCDAKVLLSRHPERRALATIREGSPFYRASETLFYCIFVQAAGWQEVKVKISIKAINFA